jgi:hypothetical protein
MLANETMFPKYQHVNKLYQSKTRSPGDIFFINSYCNIDKILSTGQNSSIDKRTQVPNI